MDPSPRFVFVSRCHLLFRDIFRGLMLFFHPPHPTPPFFLLLLAFFREMKESSKEIRITVRMSKGESQRRGGWIRKAFNFE